MTARFDHLAIAARSLADGVAWVEARLGGVRPPPGGAHPRMGTHNHLLRLSPTAFLEVIAIDPDAPPPGRARWFGLDDPQVQARLAERPRLVGWVAAVDDIHAAIAASPIAVGPAVTASRGALEWLITVPDDGASAEGGAMPTLIQWPSDRPHPASGMQDLGCSLAALEVGHPQPDRLDAALDAIALARDGVVRVQLNAAGPMLSAIVRTPTGLVTLTG